MKEEFEYEMDLSKVNVVRSAKGVDMLCVDDYLFHFDRIGKNNTYRWLCNRRKDKISPCRSRLSTILPNAHDKSVHVVVDLAMGHTHPRCSDHEITKVSQRKRLSSTKNESGYTPGQPKRARLYERATQLMNPPEWISTDETTPQLSSSIHLDFEDKDRVYMLRRRDGRVMVCIDGHLYYLSGKSFKGNVYRWSCVRQRDIDCTAKICTEATLAGAHRLHAIESDAHIHPHYSATKLMHMFAKHQIVLVEDEQTSEVLEDCSNLEFFDPEESYQVDLSKCDDLEYLIMEDCEENYDSFLHGEETPPDEEDGNINIKWPNGADIIENFVPSPDYNPLNETDLTKFTFLPSAKGRKVLCLNRYLFHFDSQSRSNGHMFFTCILRRDKRQTCHVRVTMAPTEHGLVVLRINGEHTHKPDFLEILKRINRQKKLKKELAMSIRTRESWHTQSLNKDENISDAEENEDEFQHNEEDSNADSMQQFDYENTTATNSMDSAYDQFEDHLQGGQLPSKISEMRRSVSMKKIIDIDGIKMEPNPSPNASMIVQYLKDGADNISAKIEILPEALDAKMEYAIKERDAVAYTPPQPQLTNERRRQVKQTEEENPKQINLAQPDMDLTKICTLRSAKGSEMLCVDGYIYYAKNRGLISRNYWVCIKGRDPEINCKSRISTATQKDGSIRVLRVYNNHSHPFSEDDIKRRLFNEINKKSNKKLKFRPLHFIEKSLEEIKQEYGDLTIDHLNVSHLADHLVVYKKPRTSGGSNTTSNATWPEKLEHSTTQSDSNSPLPVELPAPEDDGNVLLEEEEVVSEEQFMPIDETQAPVLMDNTDAIIEVVEEIAGMENYGGIIPIYAMKLYAVSDGPPSLAVRMTLRALGIQYELINVDYCAMEHRSEEYAKMNPQKEIPVLDDDGFYLSESIAIMQYLCDKYAPESPLYPQDVNQRALVNQRLCFNMGFYYAPISAHCMAPIFFDYQRTPESKQKVENALEVFETYLQRTGTKYVTSNDITIADFALVSATLCLEAIDFDLSPYSLVQKWYETFKAEYPELWVIGNSAKQEINAFEHNPPHVVHPFHPTRKAKA